MRLRPPRHFWFSDRRAAALIFHLASLPFARQGTDMRWSQLHIPTLREDPADADAASHQLLLRGGFIRQLMAGHYCLLPFGIKVRAKVIRIIREEMDRIGAQE